MTGAGRPRAEVQVTPGRTLGIVATRWNADIVDRLVDSALRTAKELGVADPVLVHVAGAVELPVAAQELARKFDAVAALGCVIRGGTPHFDYVCQSVTQGLTSVALSAGVPVGNGVLTCDTLEQAQARSGGPQALEDKGRDTVLAALEAASVLHGLRAG